MNDNLTDYPNVIRPGRPENGEAGYWVVTLPEMVWSTAEVEALAKIVPNDQIVHELHEALDGLR